MAKDTVPPNGSGITDHLNQEQMDLLAQLIVEVKKVTGHGQIKLIIVDKRVKHLRHEISWPT